MVRSELQVFCALSFGILTLAFFSYETYAVKCSICKRSQSLDEGCEAEEVKEQVADCQLCSWVIMKESKTDKAIGSDGKLVDKEMEAGSVFAKGCAYHKKGEDVSFMEGDCVLNEQRYYCFCNKPLCNKQLPPCEWISGSDAENTNPKGCIP